MQDEIKVESNHLDLTTKFGFVHKTQIRKYQKQLFNVKAEDDNEDLKVKKFIYFLRL